MWNLAAPPGFRGFDAAGEIRIYARHLPHWRQDGVSYFVTFRLADSLPQSVTRELQRLREEWERLHPETQPNRDWETLARTQFQCIEQCLDRGLGSCLLRDPINADLLARTLHHFDGERYELACYTIMPNHVHAILRPYSDSKAPLEKIVQSWKQYTAKRIKRSPNSCGVLWQNECYDRIVRDEEHLYRCVQYIGNNPHRASLPAGTYRRWIRPQWQSCGWDFVSPAS